MTDTKTPEHLGKPTDAKPTAWQLFEQHFSVGQEVIAIFEDDTYVWGKLVGVDIQGCILQKVTTGKSKFFPWCTIRFMCHDGFPVRKMFGADGSESIELTTGAAAAIRLTFSKEFKQIVFGDPFLVENVRGHLYYPGNSGPEHVGEDGEECFELVAPDGAAGLLWTLDTCYHAEVTH